MYHFPNHIDVVFPYTVHILIRCTVLVHDNQYANYCNTDTQSNTSHSTNIRLISVHVLRTELQVSMGSAAGGGAAAPRFLRKVFQYNPPPRFWRL